ncbi:MAG: putative oxidoreductase, aryl-alcohol dehydrogenase like protein, partial [Mycobacterium sp.]|nr:putative oxidoreductase, aryl-alcohol dehydrogenase like protein [Mycobacterium sp.]
RNPAEGVKALQTGFKAGITLVDTADCYARGISEVLVGIAARKAPADIVICTKVGLLKTPIAQLSARRHGGVTDRLPSRVGDGVIPQSFAPGYVRAAAHRSLRRLRRDRIELLVLHEPPGEVIHRAEFLPALTRLQRDGDIGAFGICCTTVESALEALEIQGISSLQVVTNVLDTSIVDAIADRAAEHGVGLIGIAVLGDGTILSKVPAADRELTLRGCITEMVSDQRLSSVLVGASNPAHVAGLVAAAGKPLDDAERARFRRLLSIS